VHRDWVGPQACRLHRWTKPGPVSAAGGFCESERVRGDGSSQEVGVRFRQAAWRAEGWNVSFGGGEGKSVSSSIAQGGWGVLRAGGSGNAGRAWGRDAKFQGNLRVWRAQRCGPRRKMPGRRVLGSNEEAIAAGTGVNQAKRLPPGRTGGTARQCLGLSRSPLPAPRSPLPTPHSPLPTPHAPLPTPRSAPPLDTAGPPRRPRSTSDIRHRERIWECCPPQIPWKSLSCALPLLCSPSHMQVPTCMMQRGRGAQASGGLWTS
jgi:hypothetical protein